MINPRQHFTTYIPTAATALLFIASAALSCWAVSLSIVKLPAEDVWQHIDLISSASNGHLNIDALWKKHNHIHFIPLPKLIYALDILWFKGSGIFTVSVSMTATVLTCFLFARIVLRETPQLIFPYRHSIALLTASWLICILQWESFVNPADLQWAGLSLGLLLLA
ncbi:MAG TPA: hypothetical protein PLH12_08020, partial [Pseudomonadales bacterium]|nr:hypothetical protein [Pseudomonadales bacterium]